MTTDHDSATPEHSLLDEIEELSVLEAEELQEGVAFHAFRFHQAAPMEQLLLSVNVEAGALAPSLNLPNGATLTDADGNKLRILFDPNAIAIQDLQESVMKSIGASVTGAAYDEVKKFAIVKIEG